MRECVYPSTALLQHLMTQCMPSPGQRLQIVMHGVTHGVAVSERAGRFLLLQEQLRFGTKTGHGLMMGCLDDSDSATSPHKSNRKSRRKTDSPGTCHLLRVGLWPNTGEGLSSDSGRSRREETQPLLVKPISAQVQRQAVHSAPSCIRKGKLIRTCSLCALLKGQRLFGFSILMVRLRDQKLPSQQGAVNHRSTCASSPRHHSSRTTCCWMTTSSASLLLRSDASLNNNHCSHDIMTQLCI